MTVPDDQIPARSIPDSTYRLQLEPRFGFDEAIAVLPYLASLGVTHVYCSPYLQAAPGSTHGYDVVDHHRVSDELGGPDGHRRFVAALADHDLGQVLDIVPNHMAAIPEANRWWWDVLENGPASRFAGYFDIDWDPPEAKLRNTVLLPVLVDHYGRVLDAGDLTVQRRPANGDIVVTYASLAFPVEPRSLAPALADAAHESASTDLAFMARALRRLAEPTADVRHVEERQSDLDVLRPFLARLLADDANTAAVDAALGRINGEPDGLDDFLEQQNYRLAYWRTARHDLDYRRFFDIDTLVGLRTEDADVFDHPDGLRRPREYVERLRAAAPRAWIVVEKILEGGEELPGSWPIDGTTGYEFLNLVGGLFVDPDGEGPLRRLAAELTGDHEDFDDVARQAKHEILHDVLAAETSRLTGLFVEVCEQHRRYRDFPRRELHEVLLAVLADFPVYRTYVEEDGTHSPVDVAHIDGAVDSAREQRPDLDEDLFELIRAILSARPEFPTPAAVELRMRFQQLSGPVMAKGVEDTALYRWLALTSLNEVGGDPRRFGVSPEDFHTTCTREQRRRPGTMLALSTHDTKRSEDVRARLGLLSEVPDQWSTAVRRWMVMNDRHRRCEWPDRAVEYLLYQTLVGAHPLSTERAITYLEKSIREAKRHTSWLEQNGDYEAATRDFAAAVLADERFVGELEDFVAPLVQPGRINALAQKLVQLTAPGVPDVYQGSELWELSLVDPDNRRPVDYAARAELLAAAAGPDAMRRAGELADDGFAKLVIVQRALGLRRREPEAFGPTSTYRSLPVHGPRARHVVAFSRAERVVTIVPRLILRVRGEWLDSEVTLPDGSWRNVFGPDGTVFEASVNVSELFGSFPVALLARAGSHPP